MLVLSTYCLFIVLTRYNFKKTKYTYKYRLRLAKFLDVFFIIVPTVIILYILILSVDFLYNTEYIIENTYYTLTLNVVAHPWY